MRGIPRASQYGDASPSRGKLRIPRRPMLLLIPTISKTSNISYGRQCDGVKALGRHRPIRMFDLEIAGIIFSACVCNSRRGRLLFEQPCMSSTIQGATV